MATRTVWLGPPGSGKTTRLLQSVRQRLNGFRDDFRVIVPTATMAEHFRNSLAREGFALRSNTITTVNGIASELMPGVRVLDPPILELRLREIVDRRCPPVFQAVSSMPGFLPALARTIEELSAAGCDAYTWEGFASLIPDAKAVTSAIGELWRELYETTREQGLVTRHEWLLAAAHALDGGAVPGVEAFYWDGFSRLSPAETALILAQSKRGEVTVTLPAWRGAARGGLLTLRRAGFAIRRFTPQRAEPKRTVMTPATADDEASQIARLILEQQRDGRPWHEMGIVVRSRAPYVPLLESALARFGVPVRSYFGSPLEVHPVARLFQSTIEAALTGWRWEDVLEAILSPVGLTGQCAALPEFEYKVREKLPGDGLDPLRKIAAGVAGSGAIVSFLDRLDGISGWRETAATPKQWAAELARLTSFLAAPDTDDGIDGKTVRRTARPARDGHVAHSEDPNLVGRSPWTARDARVPQPEDLLIWRSRAAAARAWLKAVEQTASILDDEPISLRPFIEAAQPALREATLRNLEFRRDAVHMLDAQEARQWELPVVFVCGLLEGQFPRTATPDTILGEALRSALVRRGIAVRTRRDRDAEESFLLDVALTRATEVSVLSYPRLDDKGEPTLPAFALSRLVGCEPVAPTPCDLAPLAVRSRTYVAPALVAPASLAAIAERHDRFSPTGLEAYLECPFRFFAESTLKLDEPPKAPAERFDGMERGSFVHRLLAQYHRFQRERDLLAMFAAEWNRMLARLRIPASYRVELERMLIERSLRAYAANAPVHPGWETRVEEDFEVPIEALRVRGRIDRYEFNSAGECIVYDYKFSRPTTAARLLKDEVNGRRLQGGIYLHAAREKGLKPLAFYYLAVKTACEKKGWEDPLELEAATTGAVRRAEQAGNEILGGRIEVRPIDPTSCEFCGFISACRIREIGYGAAPQVEAAGE